LFTAGQEEAAERGLLLVDTEFGYGKDSSGNVIVVDEVLGLQITVTKRPINALIKTALIVVITL
jgi:hypothetical protein